MAGWATLWLGGIALLTLVAYSPPRHFIESPWMAAVAAALVLTPLVAWSGTLLAARWSRMARALNDGIAEPQGPRFQRERHAAPPTTRWATW